MIGIEEMQKTNSINIKQQNRNLIPKPLDLFEDKRHQFLEEKPKLIRLFLHF